MTNTVRIFIKNARLSFPALAEKKPTMKGSDKLKYQATFILDRDNPCAREIHEATVRLANDTFRERAKAVLANAERLPLKDGSRREMSGYEGKLYIKAASDYPPDLIDANPRHKITDPKEIADKFQPGYRVNGYIDLFTYDNSFGKGISASLVSVQFAAYDETFSGASRPGESEYPDCSDQAASSMSQDSGADTSFNPGDFDSAYLYG